MVPLLRRALILLVAVALATPLSAADCAAVNVPVCCLASGEHHCMGMMLGGDGSQALSAAIARCPYAPLALAAMHGTALDGPAGAWSPTVGTTQRFSGFESRISVISWFVRVSFERGPPPLLALQLT